MDYKKKISDIQNFEQYKLVKSDLMSKEGPVFALQAKIKSASNEERALLGKELSTLKFEINKLLEEKMEEINQAKIKEKIENDFNDIFDFTDHSVAFHPLYLICKRMREWFLQNGYSESQESEIESDFYNFEQLNIPQNHPSRDMQDTLYINDSLLLRTHNTGITARELEKNKNKEFSSFTIGKVYRNDEDDQTHSHQFSQLDLVSVGQHNIQTLIWTLQSLLSYVFEEDVQIRMRPSFFPFTEPSMEVDVFYKGRWIEILGAGMVNEKILNLAGFDKGYRGIAAGIGIERLAMIKYGIKDIREFFKNDFRMLKQFK